MSTQTLKVVKRKEMRSKFSVRYISIAVILLIVLLFSDVVIAQEKDFDSINITDLNDNEINEIYEYEYFKISVLDEDQLLTPYVLGVDIEFYGFHYTIDITTIDETGSIQIQAPEVDSDVTFELIISKEGYNSTNTTLTILNNDSVELPKLVITLATYTINAGDNFKVFVKDEYGNAVPEASVGLESIGDTEKETDDEGGAWIEAPDDKETIVITAQKEGYIPYKTDAIPVNIDEPWWVQLINSQYFPVIIALIFLIFAILYVNRRQKKAVFSRAKEITDEKTLEKYSSGETKSPQDEIDEKLNDPSSLNSTVRVKPYEDPKVEEIRISRPRKEKEIIDVEPEEDETEKVINKKKLQQRDYDWFEGSDDVQYEIDKLTGEVDEEGLDKWYEGVDGLKEKIDEKVKKKDKKKDEEK